MQAIPRMLALAKAIGPAQEAAAAALAKVVGLEALATSQVMAVRPALREVKGKGTGGKRGELSSDAIESFVLMVERGGAVSRTQAALNE